MSTSLPDLESEPEDTAPEMTGHRIWFPFAWTGLVGGTAVFLQFGSADQDAKNFSLLVAGALLLIGLSIWFVRSSPFSRGTRWSLGLTPWIVLIVFASLIKLVNNGDVGIVGWRWRWAATADEYLEVPEGTATVDDWASTPQDYPRFLGNGYWAEVSGVELQTDWEKNPPKELWRQKIGAGWAGFSIVGNYAVTQEQRGPSELVTCYDIRTGDLIWSHADEVRFDPVGSGALGGIGPRATPTIYKQRILTQGATGIVNCLDARTGNRLWSHDTLTENNTGNLMWGKACSPLVVTNQEGRELVVVSVGGEEGRSLLAYDLDDGNEVWAGGSRRSSYASPVLATIAGVSQVVAVNEDYATGQDLETGEVLWEHPWEGNSDTNASVPQPVPLPGDRLFLSKGYGIGSSLLQLSRNDGGTFLVTPLWQPAVKVVMKTKMCNVVVRDGYIYGLDNGIMQCIDIATGKSQWKKRRRPAIGHGQILLIGEVILVLTESGEILLVEISPDKYRELASIQALDAEKITWNNPAFSAPYVLVRNAEEVACYELPLIEAAVVAGRLPSEEN